MISSPAKYGVDMMVANWPWPIGYSFGLVKDRVIAVEGSPLVRPTMVLTMSFDRRLMGGAPAARFFRAVCGHIEHAERDMALTPETVAEKNRMDAVPAVDARSAGKMASNSKGSHFHSG